MVKSFYAKSSDELEDIRSALTRRLLEIKQTLRQSNDAPVAREAFSWRSSDSSLPGGLNDTVTTVPKAIPIRQRIVRRPITSNQQCQTDWTINPDDRRITTNQQGFMWSHPLPGQRRRRSVDAFNKNITELRNKIAEFRDTSPSQKPRPLTQPIERAFDRYHLNRLSSKTSSRPIFSRMSSPRRGLSRTEKPQ